MPATPLSPRERRARLRAAVLRAHPDHGGSREALESALRELRAQREAPPPVSPPWAPRPPRPPVPRAPHRSAPTAAPAPGVGRLVFGVARQIVVGYALFMGGGLALGYALMWLSKLLLGR